MSLKMIFVKKPRLIFCFSLFFFFLSTIFYILPTNSTAQEIEVRVKDIANFSGARENQLVGFGLVVGLKNTGDSRQVDFTREALANFLRQLGVTSFASDPNFLSKYSTISKFSADYPYYYYYSTRFYVRNVAAVLVTANLPPFVRSGSKMDISVSSMGDAISLEGGQLLITPLQGIDGDIYATAQGAISVGGLSSGGNYLAGSAKALSAGKIPEGAIVEKEVPVTLVTDNALSLLLKVPDFTTASRLAYSLSKSGLRGVKAVDAGTVKIPVTKADEEVIVDLIAKIESLKVVTDSVAKVVINERTGTIVIGEEVKLKAVAVSHGSFSVSINGDETKAKTSKLTRLYPGASLNSLVRALNAVGASPQDLIAILQAIKEAGALSAELEII